MFDFFIIQRIKDEEERRRRDEADRPRLEVPLPERPEEEGIEAVTPPSEQRGVLIIDGDEEA